MATTTTTRKFDENGNPAGTPVVTTQDPVKDNEAFEEAEKKRLEAQQAQMRTDAAQNWEQYKTNFNAANNENTAGLAAAGKTVMDRAFIVHNAIQGVKSGELYGGDPKMGRRFVMNAVLGFGDAVAKARGIQLVSGDDKGSMKTGFDGNNFNLVFRTGSGQYVSKAVSPEQFSQQLVAKGYLDADWNKPKDDAGKGAAPKPEKPAAEPKPTDWSAHYNQYFRNDVGEDGKALASGSRSLDEGGREVMLLDLENATGDQKEYLARALANDDAKRAQKAWEDENAGDEAAPKFDYHEAFISAYNKYNPKQGEGGQPEATPQPSAPNPEGPDDPLAAAFGMDNEYTAKFNDAQQARTARLNQADGNRTVYVPGTNGELGHWRTAAELAGSGYDEKTGKFKTEEQRTAEQNDYASKNADKIADAENKKRIAQAMTRKNYAAISQPENDKKLVSDFDAMLKRYNDEDDETIRQFENGDSLLTEGEYLDNIRKQDIAREKEMLAVVREMSPEQRQAILRERDDQGYFTERARRMRSALLYARDMGNIRRTMNGAPVSKDASEDDRDSEVAALAAVDTNDANIRRAMRAADQSKPNNSAATPEPAPQEPVAVASDATEPTPVQEEAPLAQNKMPAEVVSQQELPMVEPPASEPPASDQNSKTSGRVTNADGSYTDRSKAYLKQNGLDEKDLPEGFAETWQNEGNEAVAKVVLKKNIRRMVGGHSQAENARILSDYLTSAEKLISEATTNGITTDKGMMLVEVPFGVRGRTKGVRETTRAVLGNPRIVKDDKGRSYFLVSNDAIKRSKNRLAYIRQD